MSKLKRIISVFVLMLMVIGTMISSASITAHAAGNEISPTLSNFTVNTESNGVLTPVNVVKQEQIVTLNFDWDASSYGKNIHEDDYFIVTLPNQFHIANKSVTVNQFDLVDPIDNTVLGTASVDVDNSRIVATFNENVENRYHVKGSMTFKVRISVANTTVDESYEFEISTSNSVKTTPIKIEGDGKGSTDEHFMWKTGTLVTWNENSTQTNITQAQWVVRVNNKSNTEHKDIVFTDTLTDKDGNISDEVYIPDTFRIVQVDSFPNFGSSTTSPSNVTLSRELVSSWVTLSADKKSFTLEIPNDTEYEFLYKGLYYLEYYTTFSYTEGNELHNKVEYTSTVYPDGITDTAIVQNAEGSGTATGIVANRIRIEKYDVDDPTVLIEGAVFEVTTPTGETFTLTTNTDGVALSEYLENGTYKVKEISAPAGYELDSTEYTVEVSPTGQALRIGNERTKISFTITKQWQGTPTDAITVHVYADGEEIESLQLSEANNWEVEISGVRRYTDDGDEIVYTITEDVVEGYSTTITGDTDTGFIITNKQKPTVPDTSEEDPESKKPSVPNTSDTTNFPLYLATLLGAIGVAGLIFVKRKQHN